MEEGWRWGRGAGDLELGRVGWVGWGSGRKGTGRALAACKINGCLKWLTTSSELGSD